MNIQNWIWVGQKCDGVQSSHFGYDKSNDICVA